MLQREKLAQAAALLEEMNADLWITFVRESNTNPDPVLPLISIGKLGQTAMILVPRGGKSTLISGNLDIGGLKAHGCFDNYIQYKQGGLYESFAAYLDEVKPRSIMLNYSESDVVADGLSTGLYMMMLKMLKDYGFEGEILSSEPLIRTLRGVKTPEEVAAIQEAIDKTEAIFDAAKDFIRPGITEVDLYNFFREKIVECGEELANQELGAPAVMIGPDSYLGHKGPLDITAKKGDVITVDFGMKYKGYCSDMQRVYYLLEDGETEAPECVQKVFDAVYAGVSAGMEAVRPGIPACDVDKAGRDKYLESGLEDFPFALGHQVGTAIHDGGVLFGPNRGNYVGRVNAELKEGMCFTLEIGTRSERGIVGHEEIVRITKDGYELLSRRQNKIYLIG